MQAVTITKTQGTKMRRTHKHWHGKLETYPLCYYKVDAV